MTQQKGSGLPPYPGLLGYILARMFAAPSLQEKKGFDEESEVKIPQLQTHHVAVSVSLVSVLIAAGWVILPQAWALTGSVLAAVVSLVIVALWGARIEHRNDLETLIDAAWVEHEEGEEQMSLIVFLLGLLFTRQLWAFLAPFAFAVLTYYMHSLSDEWYARRWLHLIVVALASGPLVAALLRIYFYSRETYVRHEMPPERERLFRVMDHYLHPALERELGMMGDVPLLPANEALDRVREEVQAGMLAIQKAAPLVRTPTMASVIDMATATWQLDLLQLLWLMDRLGYSRRALTERYRDQYVENIVLPLTNFEITEPVCRALQEHLKRGHVLVQEKGVDPVLNDAFDPVTLLALVGQIPLPRQRKPKQ